MDAVEKIFSPALTVGKPANAADAVDVQGSVSAATGVPHSSVPAPADADADAAEAIPVNPFSDSVTWLW